MGDRGNNAWESKQSRHCLLYKERSELRGVCRKMVIRNPGAYYQARYDQIERQTNPISATFRRIEQRERFRTEQKFVFILHYPEPRGKVAYTNRAAATTLAQIHGVYAEAVPIHHYGEWEVMGDQANLVPRGNVYIP